MVRRSRRNRPPKPQPGDFGYEDYLVARRSLRIRRAIGVLVLLGMIYGAFWLIAYSEPGHQVQAKVQPAVDKFHEIKDNPKAALSAVAVLAMGHMGLIAFIFDDRNR